LQDDSLHFQEELYNEILHSQCVRKIRKLNPESSQLDKRAFKMKSSHYSKPRSIKISSTHSKLQSRLQRVNDGDTILLDSGIYEFGSTLHIVASRLTFLSPNGSSTFRFLHSDGDGIIVAGQHCNFQGISFEALCPYQDSPGASNGHALIAVISGASIEFKNCQFARSFYSHSVTLSGPNASASLLHCKVATQQKCAIFASLESSVEIEDSIIFGTESFTTPIGVLVEQRSRLCMKSTEIFGFSSISVLIASSSTAILSTCKSISQHQRDGSCAHGLGTFVSISECEFSNSIEANIAALFGAHFEASNCHFFGGMFQGCVVQGEGSALHLRNCITQESREACVSISRGGHFAATDSSFSLSKKMQCIAAQGPGSSVELLNCKIDSCKGTCVLALAGAIAYIHDCIIENSMSMQGVCAEGSSSFIKMVRCEVLFTKEACVVAMHGGTVELDRCNLSHSLSSRGLSVEGQESSALLLDCNIKNCETAAICVLSGAKIKIRGGTFSDCRSVEGQGMCVQGGSSTAEIYDACFAR
jgi:hypothetical protein